MYVTKLLPANIKVIGFMLHLLEILFYKYYWYSQFNLIRVNRYVNGALKIQYSYSYQYKLFYVCHSMDAYPLSTALLQNQRCFRNIKIS